MRPAFAAELTEAEKQSLIARYTERYQYDAENRVTRRTDRDGQVWRTCGAQKLHPSWTRSKILIQPNR